MSPRTVAVSVLMLSTGLLLAVMMVAMLAMLSAESEPSMVQEPPESFTGEMPGLATGEACDETTPGTRVLHFPPEKVRISEC